MIFFLFYSFYFFFFFIITLLLLLLLILFLTLLLLFCCYCLMITVMKLGLERNYIYQKQPLFPLEHLQLYPLKKIGAARFSVPLQVKVTFIVQRVLTVARIFSLKQDRAANVVSQQTLTSGTLTQLNAEIQNRNVFFHVISLTLCYQQTMSLLVEHYTFCFHARKFESRRETALSIFRFSVFFFRCFKSCFIQLYN